MLFLRGLKMSKEKKVYSFEKSEYLRRSVFVAYEDMGVTKELIDNAYEKFLNMDSNDMRKHREKCLKRFFNTFDSSKPISKEHLIDDIIYLWC